MDAHESPYTPEDGHTYKSPYTPEDGHTNKSPYTPQDRHTLKSPHFLGERRTPGEGYTPGGGHMPIVNSTKKVIRNELPKVNREPPGAHYAFVTLHRNLMLKVKARARHACTTCLACRRSRIRAY